MKKNVGTMDKNMRLGAGAVFVLLALVNVIGWWGYLVGALLIATGLLSFCGLYTLLGINTCKIKE